MKVKVKQLSNGKWQVWELDANDNPVRVIAGVRGGTISMGYREKSEIRVHVDLMVEEAFAQMVCMCVNKEGELKQVKEITFTDGTVDKYLEEPK